MPYIGQPLNAGNLSVDVFTGNGSTTVFALTYSVGSSESLAIYLDGVKQAVSTYTASGTTLTFTTAPPNGVGIEVVFLALSISLPTPGDGTVTAAKIAANAVDETKLKDALVADFTEVVVTASDSILLGDATDSGNTKRDTVQGILDLVAGGQQVVKVWINFNGTGTIAIRDSYNVTSITDNGTGDYTVTIATDFANIDYSIASPSAYIETGAPQQHTVLNRVNSTGVESAPTVTAFRMTTSMDGISTDAKYVYASAFGD